MKTTLLFAATCASALAMTGLAGAATSTATTSELLFFGATRGCEAGQAPPCIAVNTVDYDYDGVRTELEVCVSGADQGCAQVPLSALKVDSSRRSASATVPVTLMHFNPDDTFTARLATVTLGFQAGSGALQNTKTVTTGVNGAGCRVRYTTVAKLWNGTLRATLDGATHAGAAQLGTYQITDRTKSC
ncbi:MAG TPA: hypothetical protein VF587_17235 [Solirubrobacteraceae bacterium]|jgi:hypothetical protein